MTTIEVEVKPKKRGCFFYGCLFSAIILLVVLLGVGLAGYIGLKQLNQAIMTYTDTAPVQLEKAELPQADLQKLQMRVAEFKNELDAHTNSPTLVLTDTELNALMANSKNAGPLKDHFYISIQGSEVTAQISLPLEDLKLHVPMVRMKGRYLNGTGTFKPSVHDGRLAVTLKSLEAKGKSMPADIIAQLNAANFAQTFTANPTNAAMFDKFESVEVKDGKVIVTGKGP